MSMPQKMFSVSQRGPHKFFETLQRGRKRSWT